MNKIIYSVEYNKREEDFSQVYSIRTLGIEYERESDNLEDNVSRKVIKIEESWEYGKKIVTIYYDGGDEEERDDVFSIYRKIKLT